MPLDGVRAAQAYFEEDVPKLATDFDKPMEYYIARRPQFLDFCERYGLVARWVHRENVGGFLGQKLSHVNEARIDSPQDLRRVLDAVEPGEIISLHFVDRTGAERVVNVRMP